MRESNPQISRVGDFLWLLSMFDKNLSYLNLFIHFWKHHHYIWENIFERIMSTKNPQYLVYPDLYSYLMNTHISSFYPNGYIHTLHFHLVNY